VLGHQKSSILTGVRSGSHREGCAAPVVLAFTHERILDVVPLEALREHAADVPDDLGNL
jgi:uncharacterized protein